MQRKVRTIAALVPNTLYWSPGQRVRIESWAKYLVDYGWKVDFYPFEDDSLHEVLYQKGHLAAKAARITSCYIERLKLILGRPSCDVLFIFREASLIGPAVIERLARRLNVPIVYDIDDPIFLSDDANSVNGYFSRLKFPKKIHTLFRISDRIIAINDRIGDYAAQYNKSVSVVPNFVDPEHFRPAETAGDGVPRLGWSGSLTTMHQLKAIAGPLRRLQEKYRVPVRVVGKGELEIPGVELEVRQWTAETEVSDLQDCSIGLVPLVKNPGNHWKFFLKVVQYLAIGLPVVAQKAGSNSDVIKDGVNGFVVETEGEWYHRLSLLLENDELRRTMSLAARKTAVEHYSPQAQMPRVAQIFEDVLAEAETRNGK